MKDISPYMPPDAGGLTPPVAFPKATLHPLRGGFSVDMVDRALSTGKFSLFELDRLVLPRKTLSHRRILGSLTPDQSDRLSRVLRIIDDANETFGDAVKAHAWLRRPSVVGWRSAARSARHRFWHPSGRSHSGSDRAGLAV